MSAATKATPKECFALGCMADALPRDKFCAVHLNQANAWLKEESRLDGAEEGRRKAFDAGGKAGAMNGWDSRPGALDGVRWDDPEDDEFGDELAVVDDD